MSRKLTTEEFIERAKLVHGNKYDYSLVDYKNNKIKVKIICFKHGMFDQRPGDHLNWHGCPKCAYKEKAEKRKLSIQKFIEKAKLVHGEKYDYSLVKYENNRTKVKIICPKHNIFEQKPDDHLNNHGCPECGLENKKLNTEEFINKAKFVHSNKYNYFLVVYKNNRTKVKIICPKHGVFEQRPADHLNGHGCPKCTITISKPEQDLANYISLLGHDIVQSHRGWCPERPQLEIDIFIPELNLGFEFNGSYWHSLRNKNYHKEKTLLALNNNIKLIHVWEEKWINKPEQVKRMIKKRLDTVNKI